MVFPSGSQHSTSLVPASVLLTSLVMALVQRVMLNYVLMLEETLESQPGVHHHYCYHPDILELIALCPVLDADLPKICQLYHGF